MQKNKMKDEKKQRMIYLSMLDMSSQENTK